MDCLRFSPRAMIESALQFSHARGCLYIRLCCSPRIQNSVHSTSACDSANGKVESRYRDGWNGAGAKRTSANHRRKHADYSLRFNTARDERAFCEMKQAGRVGDGADRQPVKWSKKARWSRRKQMFSLLIFYDCVIDAYHHFFNVCSVLGSQRMDFACRA